MKSKQLTLDQELEINKIINTHVEPLPWEIENKTSVSDLSKNLRIKGGDKND